MKIYTYLIVLLSLIVGINSCKDNSNPTTNDPTKTIPAGVVILKESPNKSDYSTLFPSCRNGVELPDGRIYFVGGTSGNDANNPKVLLPEIYDPATNSWTKVPNYTWSHTRYSGRLILMPNGNLFYLPGININGNKSRTFHIIYPNNSFTSRVFFCPYQSEEIQDGDLMDNGKVIMVTEKGHLFLFDINTEKVESSAIILPYESGYKLDLYTTGARVTAIPGGQALITGGLGENTTHQNSFGYHYGGNGKVRMNSARFDHYSVALPDGRVYIAGGGSGITGVSSRHTEIFDPAKDTFYLVNSAFNAINYSQSLHYFNNKIFCVANPSAIEYSFNVYATFDMNTHEYTYLTDLGKYLIEYFRYSVCVVKLKNGDFIFEGMNKEKPELSNLIRYTP